MNKPLTIQHFAKLAYEPTWRSMRIFTEQRNSQTKDELWLLEHHPVFTLGQNGDKKHIVKQTNASIVDTDRGGQVTYHGPGQLIAYTLLDLRRLGLTIRDTVIRLEQIVIELLAHYKINAYGKRDMPGVYVNEAKIAALGLRIHKGSCYHGLALNVGMDLSPFSSIHPCGYPDLTVTQLSDLGGPSSINDILPIFEQHFVAQFGYNPVERYSKVKP